MYNGIGLATARGSGTNGYVQKNLATRTFRNEFQEKPAGHPKEDLVRKADAGILEHERKRKVEVKCMELRMQLEDQDVAEDEIEKRVAELRESLTASSKAGDYSHQEAKSLRPSDVHARAAAKANELSNFGKALGVSDDYKVGDAFDRDLQERKRRQRIEEKKAAREAWEQRQAEYERRAREVDKRGLNYGSSSRRRDGGNPDRSYRDERDRYDARPRKSDPRRSGDYEPSRRERGYQDDRRRSRSPSRNRDDGGRTSRRSPSPDGRDRRRSVDSDDSLGRRRSDTPPSPRRNRDDSSDRIIRRRESSESVSRRGSASPLRRRRDDDDDRSYR